MYQIILRKQCLPAWASELEICPAVNAVLGVFSDGLIRQHIGKFVSEFHAPIMVDGVMRGSR